jgi:glycosyltransferase involved in cell wall biosynthesis
LLVPCRLVVTIHDCVHLLFPQQGSSKFDNYRRYLLTRHVVRGADRIVAVSQFTRKDLLNIFDPAPEKIVVVPNALDDRFEARHDSDYQKAVLERYQLTDPFILYAGQIKPHKNVDRLIEAFAVLKSELGNNKHYRNLKLIVIGDQISLHPYLRLTAIRSGVQRDIRFFGFVPHPTLQVFYEAAVIFASPSLYEGFALAALEAMANGTPVVASNTSAFPEVLEDAALLVNPENVFEIAKALKLFLIDQVRRQEAVEKGLKQVRKFSWTRSANQVVDVYRSLADRGTPPAAVTGADSKAKAKASADAG